MRAATEAAQGDLQSLESELEGLKGKMADLKKVCTSGLGGVRQEGLVLAIARTLSCYTPLTTPGPHAGPLRQVREFDQPGLDCWT